MATGTYSVAGARSLALTKLLLTERADLETFELPDSNAYDLLVRVHNQHTAFVPEFAIDVKGTRSPRISSTSLLSWLSAHHANGSRTELPSCLFAFQTDERRGSFCWINEPILAEDRPMLRSILTIPTVPQLAPLDIQALDAIVANVVAWEQAKETALRHARAS